MQTKIECNEEIFSAELDYLTKPDGSAKFSISNNKNISFYMEQVKYFDS